MYPPLAQDAEAMLSYIHSVICPVCGLGILEIYLLDRESGCVPRRLLSLCVESSHYLAHCYCGGDTEFVT